jgi:hypothetical protein
MYQQSQNVGFRGTLSSVEQDSSTIESSMGASVLGEAGEKRFGFASGAGCHD